VLRITLAIDVEQLPDFVLRLGGYLEGRVALGEALRHGDAAPQGAVHATDDHDDSTLQASSVTSGGSRVFPPRFAC